MSDARAGDVREIIRFVPHLVVIAQRRAEKALAERLEGDDVLAVRDDDLRQGDAILVRHRIADDRKGIGAHLAGGGDVIRPVEIAFVDIGLGHEALDINGVRALDFHGIKLLVVDRDILATAELVATPLVIGIDDLPGLRVNHLLAQAVTGLGVDLMEMRLLRLRRRRKELDGAVHERKTQISFPVGARHDGQSSSPCSGHGANTAACIGVPLTSFRSEPPFFCTNSNERTALSLWRVGVASRLNAMSDPRHE